MSKLYLGVMSGTSLDGVDIALCEIDGDDFKFINGATYPFDKRLKKDVLNAISSSLTLKKVGELNIKLGKFFAKNINTFLTQHGMDKDNIKAIGLHGQTLWHEPNSKHAFSMQLGDANTVNVLTGICTVSDFRQKDVALGGQGAPFAPAFHSHIFSKNRDKTAVLNIGGIANITILGDELIGYDTGCGNVLMDYWVSKKKSLPYDLDGKWAKSGSVDTRLLQEMLKEPYFSKKAPKSTGRELFNKKWLKAKQKKFPQMKNRTIQATLAELTATTIADEVKKTEVKLLIVCGGGAKNSFLMEKISQKLDGVEVLASDNYGFNSEFIEAMAFAWFAHERICKKVIKISSVTGAIKNSILGAIYE